MRNIKYSNKPHVRTYTYLRSGFRIAKSRFKFEKPLCGNEDEIIQQIHKIRYADTNNYVITGGHFDQLFVRNMGVFFHSILDPRIPGSNDDWIARQKIVLKTIALDLEIFTQAKKDYTTIVPVKDGIYTCLNLYARPSDSLLAILHTLKALLDETYITQLFPAKKNGEHRLTFKKETKELVQEYTKPLKYLVRNYITEIIDDKTRLIKKNLLLASARDGIKRESSFYDNVVAWQTIRLAGELGLFTISNQELIDWKKRIMKLFWDDKEEIFLDDLSQESKDQKLFSADSFIVLSTGFLDISIKKDYTILKKMVDYVIKKELDKPFPLHYSLSDSPHKLYRPVRHFAPNYMGTSIWCHWGMEYIKALVYLRKENKKYYEIARNHLETYSKNIVQYGGYPEVYDKNGNLLKTRLYRSVLYNGWVINYEQAKMLFQNINR